MTSSRTAEQRSRHAKLGRHDPAAAVGGIHNEKMSQDGPRKTSRARRRTALHCLAGALFVAAVGAGAPVRRRAWADRPFLTGKLLVAAPAMPDGRFSQTVIYMCRHDLTGAMGLVLNRLVGRRLLADLLEWLDADVPKVESDAEVRVHWGGPVEINLGFLLHTSDYQGADTLMVSEDIALTANLSVLRDIAAGGGPRTSLFALGYAGWAAGQLEREMTADSWIVAPADEALLFDDDMDGKWTRALKKESIDL